MKRRMIKKKKKKKRQNPLSKIKLNLPNTNKTYKQIISELWNKINKGRINYETKTKKQFAQELAEYLEEPIFPLQVGIMAELKEKKNQYCYIIITKTAWGYDYYIPSSKEEEEKMKQSTGYYD